MIFVFWSEAIWSLYPYSLCPFFFVHFASQSAVPTFRMIVEEMVNQGFLKKER
jgi:hypothetical protein